MSNESPIPDPNAGNTSANQPGQTQGFPPTSNVPPPFGVLGQVPPGYPPPGTVQPGYPYVPAMLPPPREYAVRPDVPGQPWAIMPPRQGNLLQAWLSIATNFSRHNITAWAQGSKKGWVVWSIVTSGIFVMAGVVTAALVASHIVDVLHIPVSPTQVPVANIVRPLLIVVVASIPVIYIANILVVAWFWSLFMPPELGTTRQRLQRALLPYALALPAYAFVEFVILGLSALLAAVFVNANPDYFRTFQLPDLFFVVLWILALLSGIYSYALIIQSGAVGSALNRWAVFGVYYLASLAVGFAADIIFVPASLIIVFSQIHP
jgi:hypothetical protein